MPFLLFQAIQLLSVALAWLDDEYTLMDHSNLQPFLLMVAN